jgi:hypothetical protein
MKCEYSAHVFVRYVENGCHIGTVGRNFGLNEFRHSPFATVAMPLVRLEVFNFKSYRSVQI